MAQKKLQTRKVLSIDDDPSIRFLVKSALAKLGSLKFYEATDGVEGLEMIEKIQPDLVVLDVVMPRMDGIQVLKILRSDYRFENLPVILLTGYKESEKLEGFLKNNKTVLMTKPFILDEFISNAERLLKNSTKITT